MHILKNIRATLPNVATWQVVIFLVFFLSRFYVLGYPPYYPVTADDGSIEYRGYSDVKHDSERYANMWYYGMKPYREHLFEYPPAAIPLMLTPLVVDQWGLGNYYQNYRTQIFLLESVFFVILIVAISRLPINYDQKLVSLGFYVLAGVIGKDFWYDGLDLMFILSLTLALLWRYLRGHKTLFNRSVFWAFFWLSVAIKLLTLPLGVLFMWTQRKDWRRELLSAIVGGSIVWGIPLILYRSSLSVFLFFHGVRPIKYESLAAAIVRAINDFTSTEMQTDILPHLPVVGPVSTIMEQVVSILFPAALLISLLWGMRVISKQLKPTSLSSIKELKVLIAGILVFIFALFLSSKIFSRPFHIWYIPFIALFPFRSRRTQLLFMMLALLMLALDTSPYLPFPQYNIGPLSIDRLRDVLRFGPMVYMLGKIPTLTAKS